MTAGASSLTAEERAALDTLASDLRRVFGGRLHSVAAYGLDDRPAASRGVHSLAMVERLTFADLAACVPLAAGWTRRGLAVPLILERREFERTLDVFPLEYGEIIARHVIIAGTDPFAGAAVSSADVRRACELAAKSHLIHLREGYLESRGDARAVAQLISASAPAFGALLRNIARLEDHHGDDLATAAETQIGVPGALVREVLAASDSAIAEPTALLARYIAATERVWEYVDSWGRR
ncbi:MAG: hypothetical protein A3H96_13535 [Acidobacteria bacterium RIFCSPLOWO2_02_FULL_67_36]|nr:MAG: hypothetical protein A3H96_13535 [Acidobacteria bacterium RIFCSPLOWO2_02_FULL_67_36]OFW25641.1 MAG: hypothetical protein A3G21_09980 [Acidobacteria bacterium RIFCSPLOWO2_12_FULL_66_21]